MLIRRLLIVAAFCLLSLMAALSASADNAATDRQIIQVLNRIGFGPTAADVAHVRKIGIDRYIDEQLNPDAIPEPAALTQHLAGLDTLRLDAAQLFAQYGPLKATMMEGGKPTPEEVKARVKLADGVRQQASEARVYRALYSNRQLQEAMVDFWFNHFNVFAHKGFVHFWVGNYEAQAIRPYALGHFRDLLLATARHPAMLFYLDNQINTAPGSPNAKGDFTGLNENYAREIMELHTLGVDGGYTQDDVTTLARIFTGWGFNYRDLRAGSGPAYAFDPKRHDPSDKVFLGQQIHGGGEDEGVAAIDILARSPATAHHIAYQLAEYFVADNPPASLVDRLAARFHDTDGDITAVMKTLLTSREFRDSAGQKYKTPYQYVLSAVRAAGLDVGNARPLLGTMAQLGMPLYLCPTPDGYKNTEAAWLSPDATTLRINFANLLGSGAFRLYAPPPDDPELPLVAASAGMGKPKVVPVDGPALESLLEPILGERTKAAIAEQPEWLHAAMVLGSPDFMRR
jgi:uncharacterized protein (DUF1800 family)